MESNMATLTKPVDALVLSNLANDFDEETIRDLVEVCLEIDNVTVKTYKNLPGRALVLLGNHVDFNDAVDCLKEEAEDIDVERPELKDSTVVVSNITDDGPADALSEEFLEIYFCVEFGDGENIVESCKMYPYHENSFVAFVKFQRSLNVMDQVLRRSEQIPLPSVSYKILVEPYFAQFHTVLENNFKAGHLYQVKVARGIEDTGKKGREHTDKKKVYDEQEEEETDGKESGIEEEEEEEKEEKEEEVEKEEEDDDDDDGDSEEDQGSRRAPKPRRSKQENTAPAPKTDYTDTIPGVSKIQAKLLNGKIQESGECTLCFEYSIESDNFVAVFRGTEEAVHDHKIHFIMEMRKIKETKFSLSEPFKEILSGKMAEVVKKKLEASVEGKGNLSFTWHHINIVALGEDNLDFCEEVLKDLTSGSKVISVTNLPLTEFTNMKLSLERSLSVSLSFKGMKAIVIEGLKDDTEEASQQLKELLKDATISDDKFEFKGVEVKLMRRNRNLQRDVNLCIYSVIHKEEEHTDDVFRLSISGTKSQVEKVKQDLRHAFEGTEKKRFDFDILQDGSLLAAASGNLKEKIDSFEVRHECAVVLLGMNNVNSKSIPFNITRSKKPKPSKAKPRRQTRPPPIKSQRLTYQMTNSSILEIKVRGDITREDSAILVSLLDKSADLRKTNVGKAFTAACKTLWQSLEQAKQANPQNQVLMTPGPFNGLPPTCQSVCHVILSKYSQGTSETDLLDKVKTILQLATQTGQKSIAIPALGCGRAHGFSANVVAKAVIQGLQIQISMGQSSLTKVVLLSGDQRLMQAYKTEADKVFQQATQGGATANPGPNEGDLHEFSESSEDDSTSFDMFTENDESFYSKTGSVTICAYKSANIDYLCSELKNTLVSCLHREESRQYSTKDWNKHALQEIEKEAKKLHVMVEIIYHYKKVSFLVKGEKTSVSEFLKTIDKTNCDILSKMPKCIARSGAKRRGTIEFVRQASHCDEYCPSYWNIFAKHRPDQANHHGHRQNLLVDIDPKVQKGISDLVYSLFDPGLIGNGQDAVNLVHSSIKITKIQRVENIQLFKKYSGQRKSLFEKIATLGKTCLSISNLKNSSGPLVTYENLPRFMKSELYHEINEHYLFHGTSSMKTIIHNGPDFRLGSEAGMFGRGLYMAERTTKADQYSDSRNGRAPNGSELTLIMFRALLGNVFLCDRTHPSVQSKGSAKLSRPPCMKCLQDKCACVPQTLFDSVMSEGWLFREFVVYEQNGCYPEYVIFYKRQ